MNKPYGICLQEYIPVRKINAESSEMISQVLFGEVFSILSSDKETNFSLIRPDFDAYEGWIDTKTIQFLSHEEYTNLLKLREEIVTDRFFRVVDKNKDEIWLGAGSSLRLKPGNTIYGTESMFSPKISQPDKREIIEKSAANWINVSYIWGGRSTSGVDCSGLAQNLMKQAGLRIPRDAADQASVGKSLNFVFEAKPGDLAFFDNEEGIITHVGIILSGNRIIHSSGKVRIDLFDQQGIYAREKDNYTHKLRLMKNLID